SWLDDWRPALVRTRWPICCSRCRKGRVRWSLSVIQRACTDGQRQFFPFAGCARSMNLAQAFDAEAVCDRSPGFLVLRAPAPEPTQADAQPLAVRVHQGRNFGEDQRHLRKGKAAPPVRIQWGQRFRAALADGAVLTREQ